MNRQKEIREGILPGKLPGEKQQKIFGALQLWLLSYTELVMSGKTYRPDDELYSLLELLRSQGVVIQIDSLPTPMCGGMIQFPLIAPLIEET